MSQTETGDNKQSKENSKEEEEKDKKTQEKEQEQQLDQLVENYNADQSKHSKSPEGESS